MKKMYKFYGFEMFGCPFIAIILAEDLNECKSIFYEKYSSADLSLFQNIVDKYGFESGEKIFDIGIG
jgi:hypothetical protein